LSFKVNEVQSLDVDAVSAADVILSEKLINQISDSARTVVKYLRRCIYKPVSHMTCSAFKSHS
jgi:hypothetical protein